MRKLILFTVIASCMATMAMAQQKASVTLSLSECGGDTLFVMTNTDDMMKIEKTDTVVLPADGKYILTCQYPTIRFVNIRCKNDAFLVLLRPGEDAVVSGKSLGDATITGSAYYDSQEKFSKLQKPLNEERVAFGKDIMAKMNNPQYDQDSLKIASKDWSSSYEKRVSDLNKSFIRQNPDDDYSVTLLTQLIMEYDSCKTLLTQRALTGMMVPLVKVMDEMSVRIKQRMQASAQLQPGMPAPVIDCNDINCKHFTISSLQGKVVVLDFWGSWCGWCLKGMPKMKEYYTKYAGKLEIVGVDCNDTDEKWRQAVKKHQIPWLHVRSIPDKQDYSVMYNVTGFPTKVIIGKDGNIVKTFVGESEEFYTTLDNLMK